MPLCSALVNSILTWAVRASSWQTSAAPSHYSNNKVRSDWSSLRIKEGARSVRMLERLEVAKLRK